MDGLPKIKIEKKKNRCLRGPPPMGNSDLYPFVVDATDGITAGVFTTAVGHCMASMSCTFCSASTCFWISAHGRQEVEETGGGGATGSAGPFGISMLGIWKLPIGEYFPFSFVVGTRTREIKNLIRPVTHAHWHIPSIVFCLCRRTRRCMGCVGRRRRRVCRVAPFLSQTPAPRSVVRTGQFFR